MRQYAHSIARGAPGTANMPAKPAAERGGRACAGLLPVLALLFLAGCSGGPSSADVEMAVREGFAKASQQVEEIAGRAGGTFEIEVHDVKLLDCAATELDSRYDCDVEIDVTAPFVGRQKEVAQVQIVKSSGGWMMEQ